MEEGAGRMKGVWEKRAGSKDEGGMGGKGREV